MIKRYEIDFEVGLIYDKREEAHMLIEGVVEKLNSYQKELLRITEQKRLLRVELKRAKEIGYD